MSSIIDTTAKVVVDEGAGTSVVVQNSTPSSVVITGLVGPRGITKLTYADDVDTSALTDGATLVYSSSTLKWEATTTLEKQIVNAGFF